MTTETKDLPPVPDPVGWLTRLVNRSGLNCQVLCNHNSVGDYRDIDPGATSERVYSESQMHAYALEAIRASATSAPEQGFQCEPQPAVTEDGFCEWVTPRPQGYLMQCCDCDLIHEVETRVAKFQPRPSEEFVIVDDLDMQVQWRMKRRDDLSKVEPTSNDASSAPSQIDAGNVMQPLSGEQIDAINIRTMGHLHFAREIEAAHGIGTTPKPAGIELYGNSVELKSTAEHHPKLSAGAASSSIDSDLSTTLEGAQKTIMTLQNQLMELQLLVLRRPAINMGLFETYQKWNGECYLLDWMNAVDNATPQPAEGQ